MLQEDFLTSLTASIATWPLIIFYFGRLSLFSPVINALSLWLIPLLMMLGGVALGISIVSKALSQVVLLVTQAVSQLFVSIISFNYFGLLVQFEISSYGILLLSVTYFAYVIIVLYHYKSLKTNQ